MRQVRSAILATAWLHVSDVTSVYLIYYVQCMTKQESPAVAGKPARRKSMPKIAPIRHAYNIVTDNTGLSSCVVVASEICEIPRKCLKIQTYRVQGHRSWCQSKAHTQLILVINSNFGRISYSFRDVDTFSYKIARFPHPTYV